MASKFFNDMIERYILINMVESDTYLNQADRVMDVITKNAVKAAEAMNKINSISKSGSTGPMGFFDNKPLSKESVEEINRQWQAQEQNKWATQQEVVPMAPAPMSPDNAIVRGQLYEALTDIMRRTIELQQIVLNIK
jgi:N-acetylmuramoyl-L-alanine amidase CwlA